MRRLILRAIVCSLVVSLVVPPILFLAVAKAGIPKPGVEYPADFYDWSVHRQNEWQIQNLEMVGGFAYIRERLKHPAQFAEEYAISMASIFVVALAGSLLLALWVYMRPNLLLNPDARQERPRAC
jgi:hypothetical protein